MKAKHTIVILAFASVLTACQAKFTTYDGPAYIAFADTLSYCPVNFANQAKLDETSADYDPKYAARYDRYYKDELQRLSSVLIATTTPVSYDRTFAVEVISKESNAVYGYHYRIPDHTVTIKAGQTTTALPIETYPAHIDMGDSLSISLRLISAEDQNWELYGQKTRVQFKPVRPMDITELAGNKKEGRRRWCRVTSSFWLQFSSSIDYSRICECEQVNDSTILIHDMIIDDYDYEICIDESDILNPGIAMTDKEQIVADTRITFNYIYGDGLIRAYQAPVEWTLDLCNREADTYAVFFVKNYATVGIYQNYIEWLTPEEAENLVDDNE